MLFICVVVYSKKNGLINARKHQNIPLKQNIKFMLQPQNNVITYKKCNTYGCIKQNDIGQCIHYPVTIETYNVYNTERKLQTNFMKLNIMNLNI